MLHTHPTYNTNEYFQLDFSESSALYLFLTKYFSEINSKFTHLLQVKFEIIQNLLYARFGLKSTLFGIKKSNPYELSNQEEIEEKLINVNRSLRDISTQSIIFYDIYVKLAKYLTYSYNEFNEYKE